MEENKMKKHVTAIGIIQIIFGTFNLIGGLTISLVFGFAKEFVFDTTALNIMDLISIPLTLVLCLVGVIMITGAIGLLAYKMWGKIATLVIGALGLINIPLGTLKGVYIIWALVQPETNQLFETKTNAPEMPQN